MARAMYLAMSFLFPPLLFAQSSPTAGEGRIGPRRLLDRDREVALARSAAPASVSDSATIWVLGAREYEIAVQGTNGAACYVSRSWVESLEPHCFDVEGAGTILPMHMHEVALRHQGVPFEQVEQQIREGLDTGRFRLPRRPVMSWMMSGGQKLISDEGRPAGSWRPHLMIYFPFLTAEETGLGGAPDLRHAILVDPGRPTSNIMIVVSDFIDPVP